jgi:hypothetical protein
MTRTLERREDCLSILGLGPGAGDEDIRTAYRRLVMRYHPDSSADPSTARRFERIVRAYKILTTRQVDQPPVRSPVCRSIADARGDLFALGKIIASDPDPRKRAQAARELGLSGRSAAYVFLRPALYDVSESVAITAVRAAALIGSMQAEGEIAALYSRSSRVMRRKILESAQGTGERLFRQTIEAAKHDTDPALALMARRLEREWRYPHEA